jgi:hypothetical protein
MDVLEVCTSTIISEAVRTSETSVDNYFTLQYIPEDNSEHHTRRRENLKSHKMMEAVRTSETSIDNYFTRQYIPEDNSEHNTTLHSFQFLTKKIISH